MATYKSFNEIVSIMIEQLKLVQPNLDTKTGTVSRDLFIDLPADQLEKLYRLVSLVSEKQSPDTAIGTDLDRYASNYGIIRNVGSAATGLVIFTTNIITADIPIPAGTVVTSRSGVNFKTIGNYFFSSSDRGRHAATASRIKRALQQAGISDKYAIEVPVQATRVGTSGNLSGYQVVNHNIDFDIKVINLSSTGGGSGQETDAQFRARISSVFSGANTGTAQGYKNAILSLSGVSDALVVQPGNSLMLRDGTEIIEINDGTKRIISSGTGGKVDIYLLGKQLIEVSDSFIFTDSSGIGKINDERNDYILGQGDLDKTLTSEERRLSSLSSGILPLQPAQEIVSVSGSSSGILSPRTISSSGIISGNYELIKDTNPDTGGSPFGFDKIHFISGDKNVIGESILKTSFNNISRLTYSDITDISKLYSNIQISNENSSVSPADRSIIKTLHYPITSISTIQNKTTGEYYSVYSQEIDEETGLNLTGEIKISGKSLPSQSDILSVSYSWKKYFDKYIDYNGYAVRNNAINLEQSDSIDWGFSNLVSDEISVIERSDDGNSYIVNVSNDISRILSISLQNSEEAVIENLLVSGMYKKGIVLTSVTEISNISKISSLLGLELFNTSKDDGYFSGTTIVLPSDSPAIVGESCIIYFDKVEIYNIENTDASFYGNTIVLPSDSILESNELLDSIFDYYSSGASIYCSYFANLELVMTNHPLSLAPFSGAEGSAALTDASLLEINPSYQPIIYKNNSSSNPIGYVKYSPSNLILDLSDSIKPGKLRITGTSLTRADFKTTYGTDASGLTFDLSSYIKSLFDKSTLDSTYYIARIDEVYLVDDFGQKTFSFDILGYKILNSKYDINFSSSDLSLSGYKFTLPSTASNLSASLSSGSNITVSALIAREGDFEELYFSTNGRLYSSKSYGFISKINVSSGFRGSAGNIIGNLTMYIGNQPATNSVFFADYKFKAPKEGERITIRYNLNRLLIDATNAIESVRPISADVLIKEASEILVDVSGQILINDNQAQNTSFIVQNAADEISKVLSTNSLGATVDYSDIISAVSRVNGVDSVNISAFNISGNTGRKSFIRALDNQTINPGNIFLEAVMRKDFKIS
jgi:uncharacterized phage protein gp47/JayE